jgi:hypothetical protein
LSRPLHPPPRRPFPSSYPSSYRLPCPYLSRPPLQPLRPPLLRVLQASVSQGNRHPPPPVAQALRPSQAAPAPRHVNSMLFFIGGGGVYVATPVLDDLTHLFLHERALLLVPEPLLRSMLHFSIHRDSSAVHALVCVCYGTLVQLLVLLHEHTPVLAYLHQLSACAATRCSAA